MTVTSYILFSTLCRIFPYRGHVYYFYMDIFKILSIVCNTLYHLFAANYLPAFIAMTAVAALLFVIVIVKEEKKICLL